MKRNLLVFSTVIAALAAIGAVAANSSMPAFPDPPSEQLAPAGAKKMTAVLAGGCFWGMQGVFEHVKGVTKTTVGYSGGDKKTAHYEVVSTGTTGHAESIEITYDPSVVTYGQLLKIYFSIAHDPTTLNRQHNDEGTQYRSEIFYADDNQKTVAEEYIKTLNAARVYKHPIVTKLEPVKGFYAAEEHHQHYLDRNPHEPYIQYFDLPMIDALKKTYPDMYRKSSL
ncbi:MAG TPA: peptide-methionine (S)-S-oxide reductase MsrA [Bryobacteraceae bacterium]|nr:peptide-methionine (S)-S-oxide reductase MsrA [Bryobacteraceae bacterium]